jgi:hypothetical protein
MQVVASSAKADTAEAQLATARELEQQTTNRVKSELSPEIDSPSFAGGTPICRTTAHECFQPVGKGQADTRQDHRVLC